MRTGWSCAAACAAAMLASGIAGTVRAAEPQGPEIVQIWPGPAPGTTWSGAERELKMPMRGGTASGYTNVTTPTLTVFRPAPGKATGAAMIVAPGGGFQALAFGHEGIEVGQWLAARGVTAFVLKYRVHFTPNFRLPPPGAGTAEFDADAQALEPSRELAVADGVQAMRYLRAHAAKYGIAPDRIGFMGFSAGGMTTMGVVMESAPADRPNLAAPIYGAMQDKPAPTDGPPIFIAAAADDPTVPPGESFRIFTAWRSAKLPAELHVYEKGGHGFGMLKRHTTSDNWTEDFEVWLQAHGWIAAAPGVR